MVVGGAGRPPADAAALWALGRVAVATVLVVGAFAMLYPVLAVRLQTAGHSASQIGLFAALPFLSIALMVPLMPRIFSRLGVMRSYRLGLALEALATLGYAATEHYLLWCVLAAVGGLGAAAIWNATEALIAYNAPATLRGRITGLYQTAMGASMAAGPFVPGLLPLSPDGLTLLAVVLLLLGLATCWGPAVSALRASHPGAVQLGLLGAVARAPVLLVVAVAGGAFEAGLGSITTALGSQAGLSLAAAASIAGAAGLGSLVLQYPCGWLADHVPQQRLFAAAGVLLLIGSALFMLAPVWQPVLWVSAGVWGAVGGALYTLLMIRVAHDFADGATVAGTAAMITAYTVGGALAPLLSGLVLDRYGSTGQSLWLSALALLVVAMARRMGRS